MIVGLDELCRPVDRPVDVALGGKVQDGVGLMLGKQRLERRPVADVGLREVIRRVRIGVGKRIEVPRVGQLVDVDDLPLGFGEGFAYDGRADEAGASGDDRFHSSFLCR